MTDALALAATAGRALGPPTPSSPDGSRRAAASLPRLLGPAALPPPAAAARPAAPLRPPPVCKLLVARCARDAGCARPELTALGAGLSPVTSSSTACTCAQTGRPEGRSGASSIQARAGRPIRRPRPRSCEGWARCSTTDHNCHCPELWGRVAPGRRRPHSAGPEGRRLQSSSSSQGTCLVVQLLHHPVIVESFIVPQLALQPAQVDCEQVCAGQAAAACRRRVEGPRGARWGRKVLKHGLGWRMHACTRGASMPAGCRRCTEMPGLTSPARNTWSSANKCRRDNPSGGQASRQAFCVEQRAGQQPQSGSRHEPLTAKGLEQDQVEHVAAALGDGVQCGHHHLRRGKAGLG